MVQRGSVRNAERKYQRAEHSRIQAEIETAGAGDEHIPRLVNPPKKKKKKKPHHPR